MNYYVWITVKNSNLHAVKLQAVDWATRYSIFNFRLFGPKVKAAPKKVRPARPWSYLDFSKYNTVAAVAVLRSVMVVNGAQLRGNATG